MKRLLTTVGLVLMLLAGSPTEGQETFRKDYQLYKDVSSTVNRYANFTIFDDISASVDRGVVTLTGKVTMPYKRSDIEKQVVEIDGVREVSNRVQVLPVSHFDDELRYRIARAIYGHSSFWSYAAMVNPPIHIVVDRGHVTLTGVVHSNVERALAGSLAASSSAFSVKNELKTDAEAQAAMDGMKDR